MTKTYDHEYKLGECVWIKSPDGILMEVMINSITLAPAGMGKLAIYYIGSGGDCFYESDVIEKNDHEN